MALCGYLPCFVKLAEPADSSGIGIDKCVDLNKDVLATDIKLELDGDGVSFPQHQSLRMANMSTYGQPGLVSQAALHLLGTQVGA